MFSFTQSYTYSSNKQRQDGNIVFKRQSYAYEEM